MLIAISMARLGRPDNIQDESVTPMRRTWHRPCKEVSCHYDKSHHPMKTLILILPFALFTLAALPSCREKGPGEKVGEKIDDALDQRPGEGIRDAVEDVTKK